MPTTSQWIVRKTEVASQEGVVATMARQATEAGVEMLRRGGNAIDAAVAAGFAVGVVEPFNSGLGGIAVMVVHEAATGRTTVFDGTGTLPAATRADQFEVDDLHAEAGLYGWPGIKDDANNTGWRTPAVPWWRPSATWRPVRTRACWPRTPMTRSAWRASVAPAAGCTGTSAGRSRAADCT